jgi:murein DD-endopeptidase MepM/ murein hydrolase activator NlpD
MPLPAQAGSVEDELRAKQERLNEQRQSVKNKKQEILKLARFHQDKLLQTQMELNRTERRLDYHQSVFSQTSTTIGGLQHQLDLLVGDTTRLRAQSAVRIRGMYMGERLGLAQVLLSSRDFSAFLDRVFYQQRVLKQDKALLHRLQQQTVRLNQQKLALLQQRSLLNNTISTIRDLQGNLSSQASAEAQLKNKYYGDARMYGQMEDRLLAQSSQISSLIRRLQQEASSETEVIAKSTGRLRWPVMGRITSGFGYRVHPIFGTRKNHTGIDISRPTGTPVAAADGGKVIFAGWYGGYGKAVVVVHGNGIATLYGHLSRISVSAGSVVNKGQLVGLVGSTGYSTGAHLHFEVRVNGRPVNPMRYL